jgi:hypothetical protein
VRRAIPHKPAHPAPPVNRAHTAPPDNRAHTAPPDNRAHAAPPVNRAQHRKLAARNQLLEVTVRAANKRERKTQAAATASSKAARDRRPGRKQGSVSARARVGALERKPMPERN